ncbi:APC family permease [Ureaplasma ceti]|uniref:APC family permease n=1 Tax=Ureaplasma ceti TaxID=3119530 RepID=A0ABP9U9Q1_9BACT
MKKIKSQRMTNANEVQVTTSTPKKIGYFAALLMVMGSSIGSGIFFKSSVVMGNEQNNIIMSLICWIVAAITVVAIALAIVDVAAQAKKDDRGFLSWVKRFNGLFLYRASKNVFCFFTIPIKFFGSTAFFFESLQSGLAFIGSRWENGQIVLSQFGQQVCNIHWWVILIVSLSINIWLIIMNAFSLKAGSVTNKIIMYIKFVPLIFAFLIGFIILGVNGGLPPANHWWVDTKPQPPATVVNHVVQPQKFYAFNPGIGLTLSLSAIFFAYDGFYVAAGMQNQMKEPKKISSALLVGLLIITGIYLLIALSLTFGANGGEWEEVSEFFCKHNLSWIYSIIAILLSFGILGITNGYSMWGVRLYSLLIEEGEIPFSKWLRKIKKPWSGAIFILSFALLLVVVFNVVGSLCYDVGGPQVVAGNGYLLQEVTNLYNFCNLITTWQAMFSFTFIVLAILVSTHKKLKNKNRRSVKDIVSIISGIFAGIVIFIVMVFLILQPCINLALTIAANKAHPHDKPASIINNVSLIAVLLFALSICFIPSFFEWKNKTNQKIYKLENEKITLEHEKERLLELKNELLNRQQAK